MTFCCCLLVESALVNQLLCQSVIIGRYSQHRTAKRRRKNRRMGEQIPINPGLRGVFGLDDEHVVAGQDTRNENGSNRFPYLLFIHPIIY